MGTDIMTLTLSMAQDTAMRILDREFKNIIYHGFNDDSVHINGETISNLGKFCITHNLNLQKLVIIGSEMSNSNDHLYEIIGDFKHKGDVMYLISSDAQMIIFKEESEMLMFQIETGTDAESLDN